MNIDDIIALTKAGFTKDDIFKLTASASGPPSSTATAPEQPAEQSPLPAASPEPEKPEEKPVDVGALIDQKLGEAFKPFEELYNNIAIKANMPTIGAIQPRGIEDIVNDFFTK